MRIIDDKGRLFGKLNIIDLFVLLIIFSFCFVWAKYALFGGLSDLRKQIETKMDAQLESNLNLNMEENQSMNYVEKEVVLFLTVPDWMAKHIKVGLKQELGHRIIAQVLEIEQLREPTETDKNFIFSLRVKLLITEIDGLFYYQKQPVKISNNLLIKTDLLDIGGFITDIR